MVMQSLLKTVRPLETRWLVPAGRRYRHKAKGKPSQGPRAPRGDDGRPKYMSPYESLRLRKSLESGPKAKHRGRGPSRYALFNSLIDSRFHSVVQKYVDSLQGKEDDTGYSFKDLDPCGITNAQELDYAARQFRDIIQDTFHKANTQNSTGRRDNPYFWGWRNAFLGGSISDLQREIKYSFTSFLIARRFSKDDLSFHEKLADFRHPWEWFPATRAMQRTIHLHVGPTNSGKTYNALKALETAETGIYAGPLRLLAHEIYTRLNAKHIRCALVTGEEQRIPEGDEKFMTSCTVEMTPLNTRVDVAVIDEIQMIGDHDRGWAWAQAVLGIQAKEVHLCGEERAVPLIQNICARIGDKCVVHNYRRLSPLKPANDGLHGSLANLRKGDAVVSFTRLSLHALKAGIEKESGRKCAIVYGSLPPESRAQQAALFNDPDNDYDFLVSSDAIGMGLNLEIKRVVFESVTKFDGSTHRALSLPELRQISGRAGRYRTAAQEIRKGSTVTSQAKPDAGQPPATATKQTGYVTTLEDDDLSLIRRSFHQEASLLKTAGTFPPSFILERFSTYFPPNTPFSFIIMRLQELGKLSEHLHMCSCRSMVQIADAIQNYPMSVRDRCVFMTAPVSFADFGMKDVLKALARCVSEMRGGHLLDITQLNLEILDETKETYERGPIEYLRHLEALHKAITLYLWLSYRYIGVFQSQNLAFHVKSMVETKINDYLESLDYSPETRERRRLQARKAAKNAHKKVEKVLGEDAEILKRLSGRESVSHEAGDDEPMLDAQE